MKTPKVPWPRPAYDPDDQPHFLFVIAPPYSGSTALAMVLDSSPETMTLEPHGEGQLIVPGMKHSKRWQPQDYDYESIRAVWLSTYQEKKRQESQLKVVVEKSPPNMMRMDKIAEQFSDKSFMATNRDPYASCSSILHRSKNYAAFDEEAKLNRLQRAATNWVKRTYKIKELMPQFDAPLLTYEAFCESTDRIKGLLKIPESSLAGIDVNVKVKVKDYEPQPISNQNERQVANLPDGAIQTINDVLKGHEEILEFFGYSIRN